MPLTIGGHRAKPPGWLSVTRTPGTARHTSIELGNHRVVVFSGHGSLNTITDGAHLTFKVPQGITLTFWVNHGEGLEDAIGTRIDRRWNLQDLPNNVGASVEVLRGGDDCYSYRLTPPKGLNLGNDPSKDPRFIINPMPVTSTDHISIRGILLEELLQLPACRNASVHWAACRSVVAR